MKTQSQCSFFGSRFNLKSSSYIYLDDGWGGEKLFKKFLLLVRNVLMWLHLIDVRVIWAGGRTNPPLDKPRCGWEKELCLEQGREGKNAFTCWYRISVVKRNSLLRDLYEISYCIYFVFLPHAIVVENWCHPLTWQSDPKVEAISTVSLMPVSELLAVRLIYSLVPREILLQLFCFWSNDTHIKPLWLQVHLQYVWLNDIIFRFSHQA